MIVITRAWLDAHNFTPKEVAALLDLDLNGAVPAADGPRCPKCAKPPADTGIRLFAPDSIVTPAQAVQVTGRDTVQCVCGTAYWYAADHQFTHDPTAIAAVRGATVALKPGTGAIEIKSGDALTIHVHEDVTLRDDVTVRPGPATSGGGACGPTIEIT